MKKYYIYILSNKRTTTFYIGFTGNLVQRILHHKKHLIKGFSYKYNLDSQIYFEEFKDVGQAKKREKQLKNWHRELKLNLVKARNGEMKDLAADRYG